MKYLLLFSYLYTQHPGGITVATPYPSAGLCYTALLKIETAAHMVGRHLYNVSCQPYFDAYSWDNANAN